MADTAETPIWGYEVQEYINIGDDTTASWQNVTHLLSWDESNDAETYEPDYINTKNKTKYTVGKSCSIEFEKDAYRNNALDTWLIKHEDETDISVQVCKVYTWKTSGTATSKVDAKLGNFLMTPSPMDNNSSGESAKLKASLSMKDGEEWTAGTWDTTKPGFTATATASTSN